MSKHMGRRENIAVLNRNIVVEGCTFAKTWLRFADFKALEADAVNDILCRAGACLQDMTNCGDWWWGDYLAAYAQWRLEQDVDREALAQMDEVDQERQRRHYVRNHASVEDGKEMGDTQVERYKVARFYNHECRHQQLSNEHHRMAMQASGGDVAVAQDWLDKAAKGEWSVNALRSEIRAAKKGAIVDPPTHVAVTQHELFAFERWTRAQLKRTDQMEIGELDAMIADATKAATNLTALLTALAAARVAKESLPAAA